MDMATTPFSFASGPRAAVEVRLEPVYNALVSLSLLTAGDLPPGTDPWVAQTAAALSPEQRRRNRLVFAGLGEALLPERAWPSFPAYLDGLAAEDPATLRDRLLARLCRPLAGEAGRSAAPAALLQDGAAFLAQVRRLYPEEAVDPALQAQVHALLHDPPALHLLVAAHLRQLWEGWLEAEWRGRLPLLQKLVRKLSRREWAAATVYDAARAFLGDVPPHVARQLEGVQRLVVVISPHVGPWAFRFGSDEAVWLFLRDRPETLPLRQAPVTRAELLGPLLALADETRLRILELLAWRGELSAQEIIAHLALSQSNVSRHLKQLVATGFVAEWRGEGANKHYRLQPSRPAAAFHGLAELLSGHAPPEEEDVRAALPAAYRHILDAGGRVARWPTSRKEQILVLEYLAPKIEAGRRYTEAEINRLLNQWHTFGDPAILRREMLGEGLLDRTPDGAHYWRREAAG